MDTESEIVFWLGEDSGSTKQPILRELASSACYGPTIGEVGDALSRSVLPDHSFTSKSVVLPSAGGLMGKSEKYTLRIMTRATEAAEDGYKWRKYGQKYIKNSPNPRSYYKCTNPRCKAKKQVERSKEDPQMLVITYEGVHLHYPNSHIFLPRTLPPKRLKQTPPAEFEWIIQDSNKELMEEVVVTDSDKRSEQEVDEEIVVLCDAQQELKKHILEDPGQKQQGLLEDIVPFLIRNKPCSS